MRDFCPVGQSLGAHKGAGKHERGILMDWFLKRFREPSTWAGLAAVTVGVGEVGKIKEASAVAEALGAAGNAAAAGADPVLIGGALVGGILSVFLGEKGGR